MAIPRLLDRLASPAVRAQFWRLLELPERYRFRRHLERFPHALRLGGPALHYGDALIPDRSGLIHGGRVKLLHLAAEFPESPDFNILYLVSSAPPKFALDLVEWAQKRGVKIAWNQNGVAYPAWYGERAEEINAPMRTLRARADYIFYQSAFCRDCATQFLGDVQVPGEIAFNSVDMERFRPANPPDAEVCRLLATGSHHESRRVTSVLETVAELLRRNFPVMLHLAGRLVWDGAEAEVTAKIAELGIAGRVRRIPPYRQDEAPAIYQAAHILIHPKYKDPCPTVPIEAMACGIPVIGSASGGMPELVSPDAGVLLDVPESWEKNFWPAPTAMADAVEQIMGSRARYAAAARARAEAHFSKEKWLAQHRRVFQTLAPER